MLLEIYDALMESYGPQGWWPLLDVKGCNPTKTGSLRGYHPGDYSFPRTRDEVFEVCVGAILTQNAAWPNVEKALSNLKARGALEPRAILSLPENELREAIRPAGYFNQKARKLRGFSDFFLSLEGRIPSREELLDVWGVGPETADSILLYAYKVPSFVVDSYTRRIFSGLGLVDSKISYAGLKRFFEDALPSDPILFQEFHALLVEHAKRLYSRKGACCPLSLEDVRERSP